MKKLIGCLIGLGVVPIALVIHGCGKSEGSSPGGFYVPNATGPVLQQTAMTDKVMQLFSMFPNAYAFSVAAGLSFSKTEIGTYDGGWQAGTFVFGNSGANSNSKGACMMATGVGLGIKMVSVVDSNFATFRYLLSHPEIVSPTITSDELLSGKDIYFVPTEAAGHEKLYRFKLRISTRSDGRFKKYEMWGCRTSSGSPTTPVQEGYESKEINGNTYIVNSYGSGNVYGKFRYTFTGTLADPATEKYTHKHAVMSGATYSGNKAFQMVFDQNAAKFTVEIQRSAGSTSEAAEKRYGEATAIDNNGGGEYQNKQLAMSAGAMSVGGTAYGWDSSLQATTSASEIANVNAHAWSDFVADPVGVSESDGTAWDCAVPSGTTTYVFDLPTLETAATPSTTRFADVSGNEGGYFEPPTCSGLSQ